MNALIRDTALGIASHYLLEPTTLNGSSTVPIRTPSPERETDADPPCPIGDDTFAKRGLRIAPGVIATIVVDKGPVEAGVVGTLFTGTQQA